MQRCRRHLNAYEQQRVCALTALRALGEPASSFCASSLPGALGNVGTAATAIKAERWAWVTVTRKDGELKTYVNGRLCAEVKLEPIKVGVGTGGGMRTGTRRRNRKERSRSESMMPLPSTPQTFRSSYRGLSV